jgi:hypothetical protein
MTWHIIDKEIEREVQDRTQDPTHVLIYKNVSFMTRFGPTLKTKLFILKACRLYHIANLYSKYLQNLRNSNAF